MTKLDQPPMHTDLGSVGWMRQFRYFSWLYGKINSVEGDVVECGVGQGRTFAMLCYLAGSEQAARSVIGFDSFAGFPVPTEEDVSWRNPQAGEWNFSADTTRDLLGQTGITTSFPDLRWRLVKGFFSETLPYEAEYPIAFLHVDADLYESCREVMSYLFSRVTSGGVVAFDDYNDIGRGIEKGEKWPGATKAINEILQEHGLVPEKYEEYSSDYHFVKYFVTVP